MNMVAKMRVNEVAVRGVETVEFSVEFFIEGDTPDMKPVSHSIHFSLSDIMKDNFQELLLARASIDVGKIIQNRNRVVEMQKTYEGQSFEVREI
jgi:hypothetical protein